MSIQFLPFIISNASGRAAYIIDFLYPKDISTLNNSCFYFHAFCCIKPNLSVTSTRQHSYHPLVCTAYYAQLSVTAERATRTRDAKLSRFISLGEIGVACDAILM